MSLLHTLLYNLFVADCYYLSRNTLDWQQSEDFCLRHCGSNLASIHNDSQYNELIALIEKAASDTMLNINPTVDTHIGLRDSDANGVWSWADESTFDYGSDVSGGESPWDTSNPNESGNPICVQIEGSDNGYKWNDVSCDSSLSLIFACNHCDGVITKYGMVDIRTTRSNSVTNCEQYYGTELMSFHSQTDWDEAVRLCTLINEQTSLTPGPYGDVEDDCYLGLYQTADTPNIILEFDDGTTFDWSNDYGYPWNRASQVDFNCIHIQYDGPYWLSDTGCFSNQWAMCNMPSEICYSNVWTSISGNGWSFSTSPCTVSNSYSSNHNALMILEEKRFDNHGQNIVFEIVYTMNDINPSQSEIDASTAGIVWHVNNICAKYYYIGINDYDDTVFLAQVDQEISTMIHTELLGFAYATGTYYTLRVIVTPNNVFTIYVNDVLLLFERSGSVDFNSLDATDGYIGIKNTRSSISVKSLFVSGEAVAETGNDATLWFGVCAVTDDPTSAPTDVPIPMPTDAPPTVSPITLSPTEYPTLSPITLSPTEYPTLSPTLNDDVKSTEYEGNTDNDKDTMIVVFGSTAIVSTAIVVCCICCFGTMYYMKYRNKKLIEHNTRQVSMVQMNSAQITDGNKPPIDAINSVSITDNEVNKHEAELVRLWLTETVGLSQYFDRFIQNGFDSMRVLEKIHDEGELMEIGITEKGHLLLIMAEIRDLRYPEGVGVKTTKRISDDTLRETEGKEEIEGAKVTAESDNGINANVDDSDEYEDMYVQRASHVDVLEKDGVSETQTAGSETQTAGYK